MALFRYTGPTAATHTTLAEGAPEGASDFMAPGQVLDLDPAHSRVQRLLSMGLLRQVEVPGKSTPNPTRKGAK